MKYRIRIKNLLFITLGCLIMGFGINYFNIANGLAEGGVTGLTILFKFLFDIEPAYSNLLLNIPLVLIGWRVFGRTSFIYTIYGIIMLSVSLYIFQNFRLPLDDLLLASLYAGLAVGVGLGVIFRYGGTTGGVDIIARLCNKYFGWSMGKTLLIGDAAVIAVSLYYLDLQRAMYTLVAVFIGARVIDFVQQGSYAAKACMIVSEHTPQIAQRILKEMERGATLLQGRGTYTGMNREVLYVVVSRRELMRLKHIVNSVDPHAFVSVSDVHEVLGEGFTLDENKKPLHDL